MTKNIALKVRAIQMWRTHCPLCKTAFTCRKKEDAVQKAELCLARGIQGDDVFEVGEDVMTTDYSGTRPPNPSRRMRIIERHYEIYPITGCHVRCYLAVKLSDVNDPRADHYLLGEKDMWRPEDTKP